MGEPRSGKSHCAAKKKEIRATDHLPTGVVNARPAHTCSRKGLSFPAKIDNGYAQQMFTEYIGFSVLSSFPPNKLAH